MEVAEDGTYDVFVVYIPENLDKRYSFECGDNVIAHTLPGVDPMIQTSYVGKMDLKAGKQTFKLDHADRCYPLEPLGLEVKKIIVRKSLVFEI